MRKVTQQNASDLGVGPQTTPKTNAHHAQLLTPSKRQRKQIRLLQLQQQRARRQLHYCTAGADIFLRPDILLMPNFSLSVPCPPPTSPSLIHAMLSIKMVAASSARGARDQRLVSTPTRMYNTLVTCGTHNDNTQTTIHAAVSSRRSSS